ncbi:hypothetical protein ABBQ38_009037 [Trebouxia sp. C0009 RCD-2024]
MKSFSEAWGRFCMGMDYNDYSLLQSPARQLLTMVSKGCNPVVCYDGARLTAQSFGDMKKSACLLVSSLTHPTRLLTLRRNPQMLAASVRSMEHASQGHPQLEGSTPSAPTPPPPAAPHPPSSSQALLTDGSAQHQHDAHQALAPSQSHGSRSQHSDVPGLELRDGFQRQLSLDTVKEQHVYRSWSRAGNRAQLQGAGPVVDAHTIPARGTNAAGVSAQQLHISVRRHYKEKGNRLLEAAVAEHDTWDSAAAMRVIRFSDQKASKTNATTADVSLCGRAEELQKAGIPLQLVSGWLDSTAAAAINLYRHCGQAPGSELVIGPWSHGGLVDQSVAQGSSFDQPKHSMAFVNRCCDHAPAIVAGVQSQSQSSHTSQAQQRHDGTVSSNISDVAQMSEGQLGFEPVHTSEAHTRDGPQEGLSKEDEDAASPSVHFFMMGDAAHRGWRASHSWPPPHAASPPLKLFLDKAPAPAAKATRSWFGNYRKPAQVANTEDSASHHSTNPPPSQLDPPTSQLNPPPVWASTEGTAVTQVGPPTSRKHPELGQLSRVPAQQSCRFRHDVELQKHPKGLSRYDAISKVTKSMHYDNLGKCGHLTFTTQPLQEATQVVWAVGLELWVESSGPDADVFAYLEDIDLKGNIRYVTEGMFRASHRKEYSSPPQGHPRARATMPGEPFHSYTRADAEAIPQGAAVLCRFQMLPTAYTFAQSQP